jgi:excisionase family DNA binding protein
MGDREVMTAAEAAEFLQIHIKTLYDWIKAGKLRVIRLGPRSTRILKQDVMLLLESSATVPSGATLSEKGTDSSEALTRASELAKSTPTKDMKAKIKPQR